MDRNRLSRDPPAAYGIGHGALGSLDRALASLARAPRGPSWEEARDAVLPLLERRGRAWPIEQFTTVRLEPGVRVGFGLDLGPIFVHVTAAMLQRWELEEDRLTRQAIGNLRERARLLGPDVVGTSRFGLTPASVLRVPEGWASSLILAPDLLPRWFGTGARLFLAPGRNLLIGLAVTTDPRLARWLGDTIASELPDALDVPLLVFDGQSLRCVGQDARMTWYTPPERSVT